MRANARFVLRANETSCGFKLPLRINKKIATPNGMTTFLFIAVQLPL